MYVSCVVLDLVLSPGAGNAHFGLWPAFRDRKNRINPSAHKFGSKSLPHLSSRFGMDGASNNSCLGHGLAHFPLLYFIDLPGSTVYSSRERK